MSQVEEIREATRTLNGPPGSQSPDDPRLRPLLQQLARYWWVELLPGVLWVVVALVVLKFNHASVVTVGVLTGIMFLVFAAEEFALAVPDDGASRWVRAIFGVLLAASGIIALIHPEKTFAGFADILGFVFLMLGIIWTVQAFAERVFNDLWWLPDQRHPDGWTGVPGQRPVLPHPRGHVARLRRHLGAGEGHHRYRAGVPNPSARLELTDVERPRNPGWIHGACPPRGSGAWPPRLVSD